MLKVVTRRTFRLGARAFGGSGRARHSGLEARRPANCRQSCPLRCGRHCPVATSGRGIRARPGRGDVARQASDRDGMVPAIWNTWTRTARHWSAIGWLRRADRRGTYDVAHAVWADPDLADAVAHLRRLADDEVERRALGARAREAACMRLGPHDCWLQSMRLVWRLVVASNNRLCDASVGSLLHPLRSRGISLSTGNADSISQLA